LWAPSEHLGYSKILHRSTELGWFPLASGFLLLELPRTAHMPKDAVAIAVQRQGDPFAFDDRPQQTEVAVAVLLSAEERPGDRPSGVIDR